MDEQHVSTAWFDSVKVVAHLVLLLVLFEAWMASTRLHFPALMTGLLFVTVAGPTAAAWVKARQQPQFRDTIWNLAMAGTFLIGAIVSIFSFPSLR